MMKDEPHDTRKRGPIPGGLAGMLALVVLVEGWLAGHALDFTRFYIHDWTYTGQAARSATPGCSVLCFGDSQVKFGVVPRVLEAQLGPRIPGGVYNLAVCNGQAASSYFLLRRALETGARPRAVVVDFAPHLLASGPRHNLRQWPELVSVGEWLDLGWTVHHAGLFAELSLARLLPSAKDRDEIRGCVRAALRGVPGSRRDEVIAHVEQWRRDRGAALAPERPSYRGEIDAANPSYFPRSWKCHPVNEVYLRRFLTLAEAREIPVFWLLPPTVPQFQARRDTLGLETSHDRLLARLQADFANLTVIDGRHAGYGPDRFIDPLHLDRRGALALSVDLAEVLSRHLDRPASSPRWVALPASGAAGPKLADRKP